MHPLSVPFQLGAFAHSVNFSDDTSTSEFLPDGTIVGDNEMTDAAWQLDGNILTMTWRDRNEPSGGHADTVTLASHGRWYVGRRQNGTIIRGVRSALFAGDFNNDGAVDAADYAVWRKSLGFSGEALAADADRDGVVEQSDVNAWRRNYRLSTFVRLGAVAAMADPTCSQMFGTASIIAAVTFPGTGNESSQAVAGTGRFGSRSRNPSKSLNNKLIDQVHKSPPADGNE